MAELSTELTDAYRLLASRRRRLTLHHLSRHDAPVQFDALASRVAAGEADVAPEAVDEATVEEVRTELYHVHLPMLAAGGVVTFEDSQGAVELVDEPALL